VHSNTGLGTRQDLLAPAAEDEGVAALEPDDIAARQCMLDEETVDLLLRRGAAVRLLADVDDFRVGSRPLQDTAGD